MNLLLGAHKSYTINTYNNELLAMQKQIKYTMPKMFLNNYQG